MRTLYPFPNFDTTAIETTQSAIWSMVVTLLPIKTSVVELGATLNVILMLI